MHELGRRRRPRAAARRRARSTRGSRAAAAGASRRPRAPRSRPTRRTLRGGRPPARDGPRARPCTPRARGRVDRGRARSFGAFPVCSAMIDPASSRNSTSANPARPSSSTRAPRRPGSARPRPAGRSRRRRRAAPARAAGTIRSNQSEKNGFSTPRGRVISRIASRPPGRSTRPQLAQARARGRRRSGSRSRPSPRRTCPSSNGSASRSPSTHSSVGALRRARASIRSEKSRPVTVSAPARRSAIARSPVPQAASRTRSPG